MYYKEKGKYEMYKDYLKWAIKKYGIGLNITRKV